MSKLKEIYNKLKQRLIENREASYNSISWFLGVTCLYNTITGIPDYPVPSLIFLLWSLLFLPPSYNFIRHKLKLHIPIYIRIPVYFITIFLVIFIEYK